MLLMKGNLIITFD